MKPFCDYVVCTYRDLIIVINFVQRKRKTARPRKAVILDSDNEEDMVSTNE